MKANSVEDDHCKNAAEDLLFPHHKMQPRVQDYGLTSDHAIPANGNDGNCDISVEGHIAGDEMEELEEEAESMQYTTIT